MAGLFVKLNVFGAVGAVDDGNVLIDRAGGAIRQGGGDFNWVIVGFGESVNGNNAPLLGITIAGKKERAAFEYAAQGCRLGEGNFDGQGTALDDNRLR